MNKRRKIEALELVKVKGKKVKEGKPQHLVEGKEYEVTKDVADALIKNGQATKVAAK